MKDADYEKLISDLEAEILRGATPVAILGLTPVTLHLLRSVPAAASRRAVPDLARSGRKVRVVACSGGPEEVRCT